MPEPSPDMRAVEISEPGGPEVLRPVRRPRPAPHAGEILIAVEAAGVNRPDVMQRKGAYPPPRGASDLPGLEAAGRVAALGQGVEGWRVGDPVCALLNGGGYAEYAIAPAGQCLPWPQGLDAVGVASLPETAFTVWANVFQRGRLQPGERLLVHGGSSGIGVMAIQLAHALGSPVLTTVGSADKARLCEGLGARRAILYREEDFVEVVRAETGGAGVELILDMIGGDYLPRNMEAAAEEGRIVSIASLKGGRPPLDIFRMMSKRLTLTGSTLRSRPPEVKAAIAAELRQRVWPLFAEGRVRPIIHATFPLEAAAEAHRLMKSSAHAGKIVLTL